MPQPQTPKIYKESFSYQTGNQEIFQICSEKCYFPAGCTTKWKINVQAM